MSKQAYLHCLLHQRQEDHQEQDHQDHQEEDHQDHQEEDHQDHQDHQEEDHQEADHQEGAMKTMGTKETVGIRRHD